MQPVQQGVAGGGQDDDEGWSDASDFNAKSRKKVKQAEKKDEEEQRRQAKAALLVRIYAALGQIGGVDGWRVNNNTITRELDQRITTIGSVADVHTHVTINIPDFEAKVTLAPGGVEAGAAAFRRIQPSCTYHVTVAYDDALSSLDNPRYRPANARWEVRGTSMCADDIVSPSSLLSADLQGAVTEAEALFD